MRDPRAKKATYVLVIVVAIAIIYIGYEEFTIDSRECNRAIDFAKDDGKISYLRNWIANHGGDIGVAETLGKSGVTSLHLDGDEFLKFPVDWDYLGIDRSSTFFAVSRVSNQTTHELNPKKVLAIAIQVPYGRNTVVILFNNARLEDVAVYGIPPLDERNQAKFILVKPSVYVYCDARRTQE